MTGKIHRSKVSDKFTIVPNDLLQREDLSWAAKGLMSYILSLPPSWILYKSKLIESSNVGKDAFERIWKELQSRGYIVGGGKQQISSGGKFGAKDFMVYDTPQESVAENPQRKSDKTVADSPYAENPQLEILIDSNTKNSNTIIAETKVSAFKRCVELYDQFCKKRLSVGCKMNGAEGKSMKEIIKYLTSNSPTKTEDEAVLAFEHILSDWDKLDKFLIAQIRLTQINQNLPNIINVIKNGKSQSRGSTQDALEQLREMQRNFEASGSDAENVSSGQGAYTGHESVNDIHRGRGFD